MVRLRLRGELGVRLSLPDLQSFAGGLEVRVDISIRICSFSNENLGTR